MLGSAEYISRMLTLSFFLPPPSNIYRLLPIRFCLLLLTYNDEKKYVTIAGGGGRNDDATFMHDLHANALR